MEKLHFASSPDSAVTGRTVAVTPGEDATTDCSNAFESAGILFCLSSGRHAQATSGLSST